MSQRPSSTYNDPGYFYDQRKLLKIFFFGSLALVAGILAMIWADFDRPWKHEQRAQRKWEASRLSLEDWILRVQTQNLRGSLAKERKKAAEIVAKRKQELSEVQEQLVKARGRFALADMTYKGRKQYTLQADYRVHEAPNELELEHWKRELAIERDAEHRDRDTTQLAAAELDRLLKKEKEIRSSLDEVLAKQRSVPELKRLELLKANIARKRSYSPLREIPLLDFLAPPTKVEQAVLDDLVDNYEFSTPKKVDRCGTCHIGSMSLGFEKEMWPVEILDLDPGDPEKVAKFEQAVYRFVYSMVDATTARLSSDEPHTYEAGLLRGVEIHHRTLDLLFADYDPETGEIGLDKKGRKIWKKWRRDKKTKRWKTSKTKGVGIDEFFLTVLERMSPNWRTHPHFSDMVGDGSPHPYERFGCTVCHQGRGWSTDFGFAYHTPDLVQIDDWMTTEWAEQKHAHLPLNAGQTLEEAMAKGNPEGNPTHTGFVTDTRTGHVWEEELGWTHKKRHHWLWPQFSKSLVQASCLKCHKEGLYRTPAEEFENVHIGKPDPTVPDLLPYELNAKQFNNDPAAEQAGDYASRMFVPAPEKAYRPESLERGLDNFLRFGCYGCHKLDPAQYPFMSYVRPKIGPQLDDISTKTEKPFLYKWVRDPKDFRPDARMPAFWGLANNSHDFSYRFAEQGQSEVEGQAWADAEVYAITEWIWAESVENSEARIPAVDLSQGDPARGERILVGDFEASDKQAKACIACHEVPIVTPALEYDRDKIRESFDPASGNTTGWRKRMSRRQGPDLAGVGSKVKPAWLVAWLRNPRSYWHRTNMPNLRLTQQEALDVAAYLMQSRNEKFEKLPGLNVDLGIVKKMAQELRVGEQKEPTNVALGRVESWSDEERVQYVGKRLFAHYGCFGCHTINEYADTTPIGTELTEWGSKLIARLEFNHAPIEHTRFDFAYTKMMNPRVYDFGMPRKDLPYQRLRMPRFGFTPEEARDLSTFLIGMTADPVPEQSLFHPDRRQAEIVRGRQVVRQYNCQGCHMIEGEGADVWPAIAQDKWRPPDLLGQGRKTNPEWLFRFMKDPLFIEIPGEAGTDRIRPWHSIRMPSFGFNDEEGRAVVRYFSALSRVPSDFESPEADSLVDAESDVGYPRQMKIIDPKDKTKEIRVSVNNRLEEADALFQQYQCKSCHSSDESVPIGNRAPNFRLTRGGRLRGAWIETWLWNPSKLQAGTAMPAFFVTEKAGVKVPKAQDAQFFGGVPDAQIQTLRDYIRHHYREED